MRRTAFSLALLLGLTVCLAACVVAVHEPRGASVPPLPPPLPPPPPPMGWDVGIFYDDLDPYGEWYYLNPNGWVWSPRPVTAGWRPYQQGRWVYTDDGWMWLSDEAWGWATYHYGRWYFDARYGWLWVPGREWAPAWVAWRSGGGWTGWAPLPPRAVWRAGVGLDFGNAQIDVSIDPFMWCFVSERYLFEPGISVRLEPAPRNVTIIHITQNVTNYGVMGNRILNRGPAVEPIETAYRRPVVRYSIADPDPRTRGRGHVITGREVRIFRPSLKEAPPGRSPRSIGPADDPSEDEARGGGPWREAAPAPPAPGPSGPAPPAPIPTPPRPAPPAPGPGPSRPAPGPPGERPGYVHSREVAETLQRQEEERTRLDAAQETERARLERLHQEQSRRPPAGVSSDDLQRQQEAEHRALVEQSQRQRKVLIQRQDRDLKGKARKDATKETGEQNQQEKKEQGDTEKN